MDTENPGGQNPFLINYPGNKTPLMTPIGTPGGAPIPNLPIGIPSQSVEEHGLNWWAGAERMTFNGMPQGSVKFAQPISDPSGNETVPRQDLEKLLPKNSLFDTIKKGLIGGKIKAASK